jgi:DNA topoisomerase-6 subunit B
MPSYQSELGEGGGIAEELAESQQAISIAEFFEKNKHMLGFDSGARGLVTAVKEAVDNALDATEEAGIHPDIYVEISEVGDYYRLVVEDNGPGITKEQIPKIFGKLLYGSRFHAREQNRGQQGIGISAAVLYSQLTSGKPPKITSRTEGSDRAKYFELVVDTDENEPEIRHEEELTPGESDLGPQHGTRIELEMEANMRARQQLHQYVKNTAVVNPHARIELQEPGLDEPLKFERVEGADLPAETEEIRPHPHGVELGTVLKMLESTSSHSVSGFLQEEFTRVGKKTADSVIDAFRDRHYGREISWTPPRKHEDADLTVAVRAATSNKGQKATRQFARDVSEAVGDRERIAHHELREIVDDAADDVADAFDKRFGETVREKAAEAAWRTLTGVENDADDRRGSDLYRVVDDATTKRKDDAAIRRVADRLSTRLGGLDDHRDRVTRDQLHEFVDWAADGAEEREDVSFGETARENVVEAVWERSVTVPDDPPKVRELAADRDAASELVDGMRSTDIMAPPTGCLSPITDELVEAGLRKEYDADFYAASTRDADVSGGDPFIVEAGIAYGGELEQSSKADVLRFANRVPLVYQRGACAITDVVKNIGWRNYKLDQPGGSGIPNGPVVVMVHVASTNVPFTSESKDAVANVPEMESEIELAVREAARELKSFLKKRQSMKKRRRKQDVIATILPEMAEKVADVAGEERPDIGDALARIMNNVLVRRSIEGGDGERTVRVRVENHTDTDESVEVTEMVTAEPRNLSDGATTVEMDGEWFVKWETDVGSDDEAVLEYCVEDDAEFDLTVDGVEDEKVTVTAGDSP